jgi:hypothetical protein
MGYLEDEDQKYLDDVQAVKAWWNDSRWRYTKRPFTAEQIVAKRGNLKIEYPSNVQSKKLWKILESNFEVCPEIGTKRLVANIRRDRTKLLASPTAVSNPQWSPKWRSTLTQSMSLVGKVHPLLPLPMSHLLISLIILW